jgi:hypothetical protein
MAGNISDQWIGVSLNPFLGNESVNTDFDVYRPGMAGTAEENSPVDFTQKKAEVFIDLEKIVEAGETLSFTDIRAGYSWGILDGVAKQRPDGPSENTVNAMFNASYRYGKMKQLNDNTAVVYLVGIDRFHYEGNGGHFMTTNNNDYGLSPEATVGLIFKFDGKNFVLVGLNTQANLEWSERYGNHSTATTGLFIKSKYDEHEFNLEYDKSFYAEIDGEERDFLHTEFSTSVYSTDDYDFRLGVRFDSERIKRNGLDAKEFTFGFTFEVRF